jgi:hypothetical protein
MLAPLDCASHACAFDSLSAQKGKTAARLPRSEGGSTAAAVQSLGVRKPRLRL